MKQPLSLGIEQIRKWLPHRFPFLLVDRITDIRPKGDLKDKTFNQSKVGTEVEGYKNVSMNEPFFTGHFPEFPIMPGVLITESMAQIASFSLYPYVQDEDIEKISRDFQCILLGVDAVRFRKPVVPGDRLEMRSEVTRCRGKLWTFKTEARVDGELAAEAEIMANLMLKGVL